MTFNRPHVALVDIESKGTEEELDGLAEELRQQHITYVRQPGRILWAAPLYLPVPTRLCFMTGFVDPAATGVRK